MSGPALRQPDAHRDIHASAQDEASQSVERLEEACRARPDEALGAAILAIGTWHGHVLSHAQAEEEGLFPEIRAAHPGMAAVIGRLQHEHELVRQLVEASQTHADAGDAKETLACLQAALAILRCHFAEEEFQLCRLPATREPDRDKAGGVAL